MSSKTKNKTLLSTLVSSVLKTFNGTRKKSSSSKPTLTPRTRTIKLKTPRTIKLETPRTIKLETFAKKRATRKIAAALKNSFSSNLGKLKQNNFAKLLATHKAAGTVCSICLEHVEDVNDATITSCNHLYHTKCIEQWLLKARSEGKCPNCKRVLLTKSGANLSDLLIERKNTSEYNQEKHNDLIKKLRNLRNSLSVSISDIRWLTTQLRPAEKKELNEGIRELENGYNIIVKIIEIYFEIFPNQKTRFNSINSDSDDISSMSVANKNITEQEEALSIISENGKNATTAAEEVYSEPLLVSLKEIATRIIANSA